MSNEKKINKLLDVHLVQSNMYDRMKVLDTDEKLMKRYLLHKFNEADWHGVMDAAADLRELVLEKDLLMKLYLQMEGKDVKK